MKTYLVFSIDDSYLEPLQVALFSIHKYTHQASGMGFIFVDNNLNLDSKNSIKQLCDNLNLEYEWLSVDINLYPILTKIGTRNHITSVAFLKLIVPDIINVSYETVIILDADIVSIKSLTDLFKLSPKSILLACRDDIVKYLGYPKFGVKKYKELHIKKHDVCFNSGVMIINVKRWKNFNTTQKCLNYLYDYHDFLNLNDQEALNVVLKDYWNEIPTKWNKQVHLVGDSSYLGISTEKPDYSSNVGVDSAHIIHYVTKNKPWHPEYTHPAKNIYLELLSALKRI